MIKLILPESNWTNEKNLFDSWHDRTGSQDWVPQLPAGGDAGGGGEGDQEEARQPLPRPALE